MTNRVNSVVRFSLDLDKEDRHHLKVFSARHSIQSVSAIRACLLLLELNADFATDIIAELAEAPQAKPDDPTRLTIDLAGEQHTFLKLFCIQNSLTASRLMRKLLEILRTNEDLQEAVVDTVLAV